MTEIKPLFKYHATIHIRDEMSGTAMLAHITAHASTKEELLSKIEEDSLKYVKQIKDYREKDYKDIIKSMKDKHYGNRKIKNHFAKFGITIELPDEKKKKKISGEQKTLL